MTQEEKQLLLKDLSARLPYEVKIQIYDDYSGMMKDKKLNVFHLDGTYNIEYKKLRPYLRPLLSMTDEEKEEQSKVVMQSMSCSLDNSESATTMLNDWLLSKHFDVRGLISKGLALEASEDMYKPNRL